MSSWVKAPGSRRAQSNPNGGGVPLRSFRRQAPYPVREERADDHNKDAESYEELVQQHDYAGDMDYEGAYQHQHPQAASPTDKHSVLYQRFYRQVQEERRPADCVVLSVNNQCPDYPKSIGQCLRERSLSVEMLYLQAEAGLTRALQDVRSDGSPLCILVEQTNVALSSCTVIIFSESLKIHRNMPKDQAMDFVLAEYGRGLGERGGGAPGGGPGQGPGPGPGQQKDPGEVAARASDLLDDYLEREKLERHAVPSDTRQLLLLLAQGLHLYPGEVASLADYLRTRQDHLQARSSEADEGPRPERRKMLPPGLGKPPPLLPTPSGDLPHPGMGDHPTPPLLTPPGSYPKTKPPPLLSMHRGQGPPHGPPGPPHGPRGPPPPRGPPSTHGPHGPLPRGPPHHHGHPPPHGPLHHGPRGAPPSLKSLHMGPLLPCPGAPRR